MKSNIPVLNLFSDYAMRKDESGKLIIDGLGYEPQSFISRDYLNKPVLDWIRNSPIENVLGFSERMLREISVQIDSSVKWSKHFNILKTVYSRKRSTTSHRSGLIT